MIFSIEADFQHTVEQKLDTEAVSLNIGKVHVCVSLCQDLLLYRDQGIVDFDEVLLTVLLQDQSVEVQADSVRRVGPQPPLQVDVWWIREVRKPRRLDDPVFPDVDVKRLPHWKKKEKNVLSGCKHQQNQIDKTELT